MATRKRRVSTKTRKPYDTTNRPRTTWKCRWVPRRRDKRVFRERDAARIACRVVREGGSKAVIEQHYRQLCLGEREKQPETVNTLRRAQATLAESINMFNEQSKFLAVVGSILAGIALLLTGLGFVPSPIRIAVRPLQLAARGAERQVQSFIADMERQAALNREAISQITRTLEREIDLVN